MIRQKKIIGIVGGLGPFAHVNFEQKLLESAQALAGATRDQDYPEWILSSTPQTPDRTLAIGGAANDPLPWLLRSLRRLARGDAESPGADFVTMPCNTAHLYLPQLREASSIPILDMVRETACNARETLSTRTVGILATTGTLQSGLYAIAFREVGMEIISPFDLQDGEAVQRDCVMAAIYGPWKNGTHAGGGIKAYGYRSEFRGLLERAASKLVAAGATTIIAGCTEIPIALSESTAAGVSLLDPTRVLAEAAIREAYGL